MSVAVSADLLKVDFKLCVCSKESLCTTQVRLKFMLMEGAAVFAAFPWRFALTVGDIAGPD